jgi:hypothetical protein
VRPPFEIAMPAPAANRLPDRPKRAPVDSVSLSEYVRSERSGTIDPDEAPRRRGPSSPRKLVSWSEDAGSFFCGRSLDRHSDLGRPGTHGPHRHRARRRSGHAGELGRRGIRRQRIPNSWIPNVALVLVLVVGIFWQWLFGLATSPQASWRERDGLVTITGFGRRRLRMQGARVLRFRLVSPVGTVDGVMLLDRKLRPLVLLDPFRTGFSGQINRLTESHGPSSVGRAALEYIVGFVWLLTTVLVVLAFLASADVLTGALGRG